MLLVNLHVLITHALHPLCYTLSCFSRTPPFMSCIKKCKVKIEWGENIWYMWLLKIDKVYQIRLILGIGLTSLHCIRFESKVHATALRF